MVAVVVMMVMRYHAAIHVSSGKRGSGECDCGKGRDEFDLVHGMVPFLSRKPILALTQRQDDPPEVSDKRFGSSKNLVEQHASKKYKLRAFWLSLPLRSFALLNGYAYVDRSVLGCDSVA